MAGEFSPVVNEVDTRQQAIGGYRDRAFGSLDSAITGRNGLGDQLASMFQPDDPTKPFQKRVLNLVQTAQQRNDLTGKPTISSQEVQRRAQIITAEAYVAGEDVGRAVSASVNQALAGQLGVVSQDIRLEAERKQYLSEFELGSQIVPGGSEEEILQAGREGLQVQYEIDQNANRIALAMANLQYNKGTREENEAHIAKSGSNIVNSYLGHVVTPALRQLTQAASLSPEALTQARTEALQQYSKTEQVIRQALSDTGMDGMQIEEQLRYARATYDRMLDGFGILSGLNESQVKNIMARNQIDFIDGAGLAGRIYGVFGNSPGVMEAMGLESANSRVEFGQGALGFFNRINSTRNNLRTGNLENGDNDIKVALKVLDSPDTSVPQGIEAWNDSAMFTIKAALSSDSRSQQNATKKLSSPQFLAELNRIGSPAARAQVAAYHARMAQTYKIQVEQVAARFEGVEVVENKDGTISVVTDGTSGSSARIGERVALDDGFLSTFTSAAGPIGTLTRGALAAIYGAEEADGGSQASEARELADVYNAAISALHQIKGLR